MREVFSKLWRSLKQTVQVVFDEKYSHKSTISFLTFFEEAV